MSDDFDDLLCAFFHSEMPHPWPDLKLPATPPAVEPRGRFRFHSRWLLAASVAFLFVTSVALSGSFRDRGDVAASRRGDGTASRVFPVPGAHEQRGKLQRPDAKNAAQPPEPR